MNELGFLGGLSALAYIALEDESWPLDQTDFIGGLRLDLKVGCGKLPEDGGQRASRAADRRAHTAGRWAHLERRSLLPCGVFYGLLDTQMQLQ